MLVGISQNAGGSGAAVTNAGAIVIVDIIRANRVASILRDMFIFILPSPFSDSMWIFSRFKASGIIFYIV
jgi:glutaminase